MSDIELPDRPVAHINLNGVIHEAGYDWLPVETLTPLFTADQLRAAILADREKRAQAAQGEPSAIYHGNGTIDCGDSGHHNIELLKMIPAGALLYTRPYLQSELDAGTARAKDITARLNIEDRATEARKPVSCGKQTERTWLSEDGTQVTAGAGAPIPVPVQAEAPTASNTEPIARIEFRRGEAGRENEMPRVVSCNWLPDGVYEVYLATQPTASNAGEREALLKHFDDAVESARLLGATDANKGFGCFTDRNARFVHAMYESIAKHRAALAQVPEQVAGDSPLARHLERQKAVLVAARTSGEANHG